ncbi:hypothetical protein [Thalassotalea sp. ND16A]|uniref:hypothetical protein n=1 Tax=Thalassotalea sp. ND16A TaxID=1535422 RepID=UPI00051A4AD3|nr:hypothetical protein [Thalassotalea sp. ND16A]KGK00092.1 hypothetical protein ND16A_0283 [Thalassotalea sp. ND16A]
MKKTTLISHPLLLMASFASQAGKAEYFNKLDVDQDHYLNLIEFKVHLNKHFVRKNITDNKKQNKMLNNSFKRRDRNADGKISLQEFFESRKKTNTKAKTKNSND